MLSKGPVYKGWAGFYVRQLVLSYLLKRWV